MRVLAIYFGGGGTEWCRVVDGSVIVGFLHGDALWPVIARAVDDGLAGTDQAPLTIVVDGDIPTANLIDLLRWGVSTPGIEVVLCARGEVAAALRAVRRSSWPMAQVMRGRGLLFPDAPARRAAALALDMARRRLRGGK